MEGKLKENPKPKGTMIGELIDLKTGKVVQREVVGNLVTDVGENMLAYLLKGDQSTKGYVTHASLCDSTDDPLETDTTEVGTNKGPRKTITATISASKITFEVTWDSGEANYTIRRGYLFTAASGGNLFATGKFSTSFTKTSDYAYKLTYEVTFA